MTHKEEAKELVDKIYNGKCELGLPLVIYYSCAKAVALIIVEELIAENENIGNMIGQTINDDYWQQVKYEINNL